MDPEQLKTFTERMRSQLLEAEQLERRFASGEIVTDPATRSHLKLEVGLLRQYLALADSEDAAELEAVPAADNAAPSSVPQA